MGSGGGQRRDRRPGREIGSRLAPNWLHSGSFWLPLAPIGARVPMKWRETAIPLDSRKFLALLAPAGDSAEQAGTAKNRLKQ